MVYEKTIKTSKKTEQGREKGQEAVQGTELAGV